MNQNDLVADDIFATKITKTANKVEVVTQSSSIPIGYIPVTFACGDKLSAPVLHFRNYSMEELLELASANESNQFSILVKKVLNNMVYEKVDCSTLHSEQIKQILMTIYLNFWGKTLIKVPYIKDEETQDVGYTDVDINSLDVTFINEKFKEPFTITDDVGLKVKFILPRVNHVFVTDSFIKDFYKEEEVKFAKTKKMIALIDKLSESEDENIQSKVSSINLSEEDEEAYEAFLSEKGKMYFCVLESQLIHSINGKELVSLEEKINAFRKIVPVDFWFQYKKNVEEYAKFGISNDYTFNENGEKFTRRFSFRLTDFIPSVEQKTNRKYSVQFDD